METLKADRLQVPDSLEEINRELYLKGMTDGLPIIPPTEERVKKMLEGTTLEPDHEVAVLPPAWAPASVEAIAINAVMAGCLPAHLPVLVAAVQAIADPEFNLLGTLSTTGGNAVSIMLNGPVRHELDVNCSNNLFGPGKLANAVIGRALRLIQINIAGAIPGSTDKSCHGWPGKYTLCWGENEEASPWDAFHVEAGFGRDESTVTVFATGYLHKIGAGWTTTGLGALQSLAHAMRPADKQYLYKKDMKPFLVLGPENAHQIARDGISKAQAQEYLFYHARGRFEDIYHPDSGEKLGLEEMRKRATCLWPDGTVSLAERPEDILVVVAGGPGRQSVFFPPTTRSTPVTLRIDPAIRRSSLSTASNG
ncbi:MAG: hypothetical protein HYY45_09690 [Deltaproteobacteria bacterium]|nr:hypothetical protein [Deltaproteobacteria bacterium]